jgi:hypothetical protein
MDVLFDYYSILLCCGQVDRIFAHCIGLADGLVCWGGRFLGSRLRALPDRTRGCREMQRAGAHGRLASARTAAQRHQKWPFGAAVSGPVYSLQPSVLLAFLLVSGEQTFTENFAIPNERIEQIARKNDGASANSNTSTAAPPDRNSTMARGAPPRFLT